MLGASLAINVLADLLRYRFVVEKRHHTLSIAVYLTALLAVLCRNYRGGSSEGYVFG